MKHLTFRNKKIFYTDEGHGKVIVFLHGFMESSRIWKDFSSALKHVNRVICIDLPGHGKSECLSEVHDMDLLAMVVHKMLVDLKVRKCVMIGHSMGGYVTLAFAERFPDMLKGYGLFHSHIFEDTAEAKITRERTIELVKKDKLKFAAQFIRSLFPEETAERFTRDIDKLINRAGKMSNEGVIAALEGMKIRPLRDDVLKKSAVPVLFIIGMKDTKIPVERTWEMISLPPRSELCLLQNVGHMGYIEEPVETLKAIYYYTRKVF